MDAELDSEAENWSGFSHPEYNYKLQSLLDKSRCRKRDLKLLREEKKEYLERNRKLQAEIEQLRAPKLRHTGVVRDLVKLGEDSGSFIFG
jgi:hypothetical protein